eukprot:gene10990-12153_t
MDVSVDINETLRENCCGGYIVEVRKFLDKGADVNSQNKVNGWTALHWAVKRGHKNIVELLLSRGADPSILNAKGELPIDLTDREDIKKLFKTSSADDPVEGGQDKKQVQDQARGNTVSFVPGYLANPVFPYAVAAGNPILTSTMPETTQNSLNNDQVLLPGYLAKPVLMATAKPVANKSDNELQEDAKSEQPVYVPGYIAANPVFPCAMATGSSILTENDSEANDNKPPRESPVNFVPGYLMEANKNEVPEEFKQIFVPHVQQLGSLVNTYVNSMQSQEKPVEYRLYNSCKTTPVATVFVSTPVSEIVLKIRLAERDDDFIEIELNSKLLTYDELLNVCSKELQVSRSQISKIRKLPNTMIRRDKDVKRLQPFQELEVILE